MPTCCAARWARRSPRRWPSSATASSRARSSKGFNQKKVEKIFDLMEQFAGYGFNKSHSAAYAYLAFVTAYLKAHYPMDFMAALLTSETGNTAKVVKYINECREMGITVLPPDVNHSANGPSRRTGRRSASAWARSRTSANRRWKRSARRARKSGGFHIALRVLRAGGPGLRSTGA